MKIFGYEVEEITTPAIHPVPVPAFEVRGPEKTKIKLQTKRHPDGRIEITGPPEAIALLLAEAKGNT